MHVGHGPKAGRSKRGPHMILLLKVASLILLSVGTLSWLAGSSESKGFPLPRLRRSGTDVWSSNLPHRHDSKWRLWLGQSNIHVSAIVFYGRRTFVRILDSYLKQNLVSAGGLLEEVVWVVRTDDQHDLDWLEHTLLPSEPAYKKVVPTGAGWSSHYRSLNPNMFYVKFDDDIMYIQDSAIDDMLHEKLRNHFWIVSANVINHSACALHSQDCAALSHLNFLQNLAENQTSRYNFGVWDFNAFNYARWSINAIMFQGRDLCHEHLGTDDEAYITQVLPRNKGKRSGAVGSAVIVHLAYHTQRNAGLLDRVNLVEKYTALAEKLNGVLLRE